MTKDEERSLVTRAKRGDTNAFEDIVLAYEKPVYNLALRYLRNPEDARDAVQETFLKSFTALQGFRGDSKLSVWLYRIAGNVCIDLLRARREAPSLTLDAESVEERTQLEIADERFDPAAVLERTDLRQRVRAAVELLPLDFRQPLLLREFGGLSYAEIAETLSLDEGTVKTRIYRARRKLCALLTDDGNFSGKKPSEQTRGGVRA